MYRIMKTKFLLKVKLKHVNHHCYTRLHSKTIPMPWERTVTGAYSTDFKVYKQLIAENLGIDNKRARILLHNNLHLIGIEEENIIKNCQICQDQKVDLERNLDDIKFLELTQDDLENRILLLKEMGAQYISAGMLRTCASRVHMVTFKQYTKIPPNVVVSENLYSHLHELPPEVPGLEPLDEYLKVGEYRKRCLSHWIKWRLEIPENDNSLLHGLSHSLRYKSFSRLKSCFDILHRDVGLSIETIRENGCLKDTSPVDLKNILTELPIICGVSVKNLLRENPILRRMKYKNVSRVKALLQEFSITSDQFLRASSILLLNPDALEVGLETIKTAPELKFLSDHPNLLQVLLTKDGVRRRLDYLRYLNITDTSIDVLGNSVRAFNHYVRTGSHRHKGREIALMLQNYLKRDIKNIEMKIKRHPLWRHVDLIMIHKTLGYLKNYFSVEDIYQNLQLLLYPKEKVESFLSGLLEMNELIDKKNRYTQSQLLALCGYQIEKEFHFTGDGVWSKNQQLQIPKTPEELAQETEEWKKCQAENPLNDVNIFIFIKSNKSQRSS